MKKLILIISLLLCSCGKTYTVDFFIKNKDIREEYILKCKNGEYHPEDINCINSLKAEMNIRLSEDIRGNGSWN